KTTNHISDSWFFLFPSHVEIERIIHIRGAENGGCVVAQWIRRIVIADGHLDVVSPRIWISVPVNNIVGCVLHYGQDASGSLAVRSGVGVRVSRAVSGNGSRRR